MAAVLRAIQCLGSTLQGFLDADDMVHNPPTGHLICISIQLHEDYTTLALGRHHWPHLEMNQQPYAQEERMLSINCREAMIFGRKVEFCVHHKLNEVLLLQRGKFALNFWNI